MSGPGKAAEKSGISDGRRSSLLFLALARDCEDTLPHFFRFLENLEGAGVGCMALIGENGSSDATRAVIVAAAASGVRLVKTDEIAKIGSRLERMAAGRQLLHDEGLRCGVVADYVCVMDMDNVLLSLPTVETMRSAIERLSLNPGLFAVGATSRPVYYDLLSLVAEGHSYLTLTAEVIAAKSHPLTYYGFFQRRIYANQRSIPLDEPMICRSSFNGLCLYKAADYWLGGYRGPAEAEVCEHVTFNLSVGTQSGREMMIVPELVVSAPEDHIPVGFLRFWMDRLLRPVKKRLGRRRRSVLRR